MFDRIVMDVIHVSGEIVLVPDQVFPETPLPDPPFILEHPPFGQAFAGFDSAGEGGFDQPSASGEVGILGGKRPDAVRGRRVTLR